MLSEYKYDLSIVIAVFNSSKSLRELVKGIKAILKKLNLSFEIIFVDDGSSNTLTWNTIQELYRENPDIIVAKRLTKNFGRPSALLCAFHTIRGKHTLMMDDDLQHNPKYIVDFLEQKHHDVVIASFNSKKHNFFKRIASNVKGWFDFKLIGKPKHIKNSSYKLINSNIIKYICDLRISHPFISGLLFYATNDVVNIKIDHYSRKYGKSGFGIKKMTSQFSNLLFNNSSLLLKLVSYIGFSFFFLSILSTTIQLIRYFFIGKFVQGWLSIFILIMFTSGIILFSLGVVGEYLLRIIYSSENRPSYIIRETLKSEKQN